MAERSNVVPPDTLEYFRLKREVRHLNLPIEKALFHALREAFAMRTGRAPHTPRELAEYYIELAEADRVDELLRLCRGEHRGEKS
jgi:hypothetical protein